MILADDEDEPGARARARSCPMQQGDFEEILTAMTGLPVTIRLLDPPLHEFLPSLLETRRWRCSGCGRRAPTRERCASAERLLARVKTLHEQNPMLGTRGCRLALLYPEIPRCRCAPIVRAALAVPAARRRSAGRDHDPAGRLRRGARSACATSSTRSSAEELERRGRRRCRYTSAR